MQYRPLGTTGIRVSALAFGAGPVPAVMTSDDQDGRQRDLVQRALEAGINWFDTAATYGQGQSERNLGGALRHLRTTAEVHVATKVRLMPDQLGDIERHVRGAVEGSLQRLRLTGITLLQIHNAITARREDQPTSITPADVLAPGGVLEALQKLRSEGLVRHLGLTAIGQAAALDQLVASGQFETIQVPYNVLNPSAGQMVRDGFEESNYGNIIARCSRQGMGVFAIRVFAGGALAGNSPSQHTLKTPFFPLDLYRRDQQRATRLQRHLGSQLGLKEAALRFVLSHAGVSSAIVGFSAPAHIDEAIPFMEAGPLPTEPLETLRHLAYS